MKAYFSRAYAFSASHRLQTEALSEDENRAAFGKCNNPHGHGHNYRLEVTVAGPIDHATGMVIDMVQLDSIVGREVVNRFDHTNLNLDPLFVKQVSTTENLSIALFNLLRTALKPAILEKIRIEETENNFFEYSAASEEVTQA
jgi:6-pyruvoyltetrahydropterin/6-carboxytetrahydropterin synthase